jgi:CBS domain containing-hemolysin-like protein
LTPLVELREREGVDLTHDGFDVETVGGYVFARLGRPAEIGDEVPVANGVLRVEELDGLRVARVRLLPTPATAEPERVGAREG